jgi:hypothetical protein
MNAIEKILSRIFCERKVSLIYKLEILKIAVKIPKDVLETIRAFLVANERTVSREILDSFIVIFLEIVGSLPINDQRSEINWMTELLLFPLVLESEDEEIPCKILSVVENTVPTQRAIDNIKKFGIMRLASLSEKLQGKIVFVANMEPK